MSAISSFIAAFCVGCVALGGLYLICPKGAFEKSVKYVFCLCLVCCVISCFSGIGNISFKISTDETQSVSAGAAAEASRMVFERALEKSGINFSKLTVLTDKADDGSIIIIKVTVVTTESAENVKSVISGNGSYEVEVIND